MDEAEAWLLEHDLEYGKTSDGWKNIRDGAELKEVSVGDTVDLERIVVAGGRMVDHIATIGDRLCWVCSAPFQPREAAHRCCSETCRAQARRDYKREQMRERRKAA